MRFISLKYIYIIFSFVIFFVTFFRLSFLFPNLYISFFPSILGILLFFLNKKKNQIFFVDRKWVSLLFLFLFLFLYSLVFDFFQPILTLKSSFSLRLFLIFFLSFMPAYTIYHLCLKYRPFFLEDFFKISCIIQLFFFFLMFFSPNTKMYLYSIFAFGQANLNEFNLTTRGFGLSGEINFMTPFLMIFLLFMLFKKDFLLKILISITQVVNSNMAVFAIILGYIIGRGNFIFKIFLILFPFLFFLYKGDEFVEKYMPRLYAEFFVHSGGRTVNILLDEHVFFVDKLDLISFLFGFQQNVATNVGVADKMSDMGWVIMMNYGGVVFILLFFLFIIRLSFLIFYNKVYACVWVAIAILFNTKGMIVGMNGYFFISFLLLLTQYFNMPNQREKYDVSR